MADNSSSHSPLRSAERSHSQASLEVCLEVMQLHFAIWETKDAPLLVPLPFP